MVSVSYSGMRLKQKGRGFDPHSGRRVVSLSKIGLGSTHFMTLIRVNKGLSTHKGMGGGGGYMYESDMHGSRIVSGEGGGSTARPVWVYS